MGMNVTRIFINTGCDILKKAKLTPEQEERLCDDLMMLVGRYAPHNDELVGTNQSENNNTEEENT